MTILINNSQSYMKLSKKLVKINLAKILSFTNYSNWDLGVTFTNNKYIKRLNFKYRNKNQSTDILSFPLHEVCPILYFILFLFFFNSKQTAGGDK